MWAVEEFKHLGLTRLFKLVISTTYERLIQLFYENFTFDYNRPGALSSSIDGVDVEVTSADITAALRCHHECPLMEDQFVVFPSMLTIPDIVGDMCEGCYTDDHRTYAS